MISSFSQVGKAVSLVDSGSEASKTTGNESTGFLAALQVNMQTTSEGINQAGSKETPAMFTFLTVNPDESVSQEVNTSTLVEATLSMEAETIIDELITTLEQEEDENNREEHEEVIVELKGWLQQALYYLYPVNNEESAEQNVSFQAINALSEQSDTVKYALQEVLHQLVEASKTNSEAAAPIEDLIHTQEQLIVNLKEILGKSDVKTDSVTKLNSLMTELSLIAKSTLTSSDKATFSIEPSLLPGEAEILENLGEQNGSNKLAAKEMIKVTTLDESIQQSVDPESSQEVNTEETQDNQATNLITAGQLAIKNGTAPLTRSETVIPVQQFSKEMSEFVVSKFEIVKQQGMTEAVISLRPQHLGQLDVQLSMQNGHLVAKFMTEHAGAKDLLEQQMTQLRAVLQAQGIQVERLEVTQNTSLSSHMYQDGGSSNGQPGNQRRSKEREQNNEDLLTTVEIQDELRAWMQEQQELELYTEGDQTSGFTAKI